MSKNHRQNEADNHRSPIFATGGLLSVFAGDRALRRRFGGGTASVNGHICRASRSVNAFLQFSYMQRSKPGFLRVSRESTRPNATNRPGSPPNPWQDSRQKADS